MAHASRELERTRLLGERIFNGSKKAMGSSARFFGLPIILLLLSCTTHNAKILKKRTSVDKIPVYAYQVTIIDTFWVVSMNEYDEGDTIIYRRGLK